MEYVLVRWLLCVFLIISAAPPLDYSVTAEYFEYGAVIQQSWQITLFRQNTRTAIAAKNFEGLSAIRLFLFPSVFSAAD